MFNRLLYAQGQVDIDGEINKCEKKLALAQMNLSKIEKVEQQADYEATVPENVRLGNEEKVSFLLPSCLQDATTIPTEENIGGGHQASSAFHFNVYEHEVELNSDVYIKAVFVSSSGVRLVRI